MQLGATGKLVTAVVIIVCLTVLMAINTITPEVGMLPITAITFYVIGNGVTSRSGKGVQSIIEPKPKQIDT